MELSEEDICLHEAAHAVVAIMRYIKLTSVEILGLGCHPPGRCAVEPENTSLDLEGRLQLYLAGGVAELIQNHERGSVYAESDIALAKREAARFSRDPDSLFNAAADGVRVLLESPQAWNAVQSVAALLKTERQLSGEEVFQICRWSGLNI